jgi:hypothetical protein
MPGGSYWKRPGNEDRNKRSLRDIHTVALVRRMLRS